VTLAAVASFLLVSRIIHRSRCTIWQASIHKE